MSNQAKKKRISNSGILFAYFGPPEREKEKRTKSVTSCTKREMIADNTENPEDQMNDNKTNNLILNLTPENVTQHSRIE